MLQQQQYDLWWLYENIMMMISMMMMRTMIILILWYFVKRNEKVRQEFQLHCQDMPEGSHKVRKAAWLSIFAEGGYGESKAFEELFKEPGAGKKEFLKHVQRYKGGGGDQGGWAKIKKYAAF